MVKVEVDRSSRFGQVTGHSYLWYGGKLGNVRVAAFNLEGLFSFGRLKEKGEVVLSFEEPCNKVRMSTTTLTLSFTCFPFYKPGS